MKSPCRILFVCHGNICRSPMAEFIMKDLVCKQGMESLFTIASAATHNDAIGREVHPETQHLLKQANISCEGKTARRLLRGDADCWDYFVGMDEANLRDMRSQLGEKAAQRCYKLMEFAHTSSDVADPWYTGDFETTYDDIASGCSGLLAHIMPRSMYTSLGT